ncbi:MAG: MAPEG family protein [Sneathiella sp.]|nr:MAPEG family protein [Sneathiella sp.]
MNTIPSEITWLAATAILTGVLWVPYIVNRFQELGPPSMEWFPPPDPEPRAPWAGRAVRAHSNAVENLVVFAPMALGVVMAGVSTPATALACEIYFFARLSHAFVAILGFPIIPRTVAFLTGVGAQMILAISIIHA